MNILLTSVGRRAYMVKYFKALAGIGQVHAGNSDDLTVAFSYADKSVITPLIYSDEYIPFLLDYCKKNMITVLISLFDIDLHVLAQNKEKFKRIGTNVVVSSPEVIEICNDKWKTFLFLKQHFFNTPKTFLTLHETLFAIESGNVNYPIIIKPRFGSGSIALSIAENETSLRYYFKQSLKKVDQTYLKYESASTDDKLIYQEFIQGQEYGADIINDLKGNFCQVNMRKKITMRAGETDIAETIDMPIISSELKRLGKIIKHIGNMDVDIFLSNNIPYILEMNARFGGGYPFSHVSGCNLPQAILSWVKNEPVEHSILVSKIGEKIFKELIITKEMISSSSC